VIAASNRDLAEEIQQEKFREDLYWRLNVVPIELPPLRKRREDVPALVSHFLQYYSALNDRYVVHIQNEAMQALQDYHWPGNVRELQNYIERSVVMADSDESPEMQMAKQQMEAMAQELEQMSQMLQNVDKSIEVKDMERKAFEAEIKAYQAETQRLSAIAAGMNPEQVQEVVMQTLRDVMTTGDLVMQQQGQELMGDMGGMGGMQQEMGGMPQEMGGMPQEMQQMPPEMGMIPPESAEMPPEMMNMPPEGMGQ
jgi:transcriptional regulator with GAF, ATPase, and Fis domain